MVAMVRVQAVRGYRELVAELGGDPVRLLRAAKIKSTAFDQPASFISFGAVVELLERSARDLACADFGLRLAARQDIGILGPLAVAMRYSATVGEAMRCASKYIYVYNAAIGFSVRADDGDDRALVRLRSPFRTWSSLRPDDRARCRHHLAHREHAVRRAEPPEPGLVAASRCRLAGHLPCATWVRRWSSTPRWRRWRSIGPISTCRLGEHNEELRALAVDYLNVQFPARHTSLPVQVRMVIERLLGTGACGYAEVADALSMHPRTLQRRLREAGTTFEDIKDEARRDLALRYLAHPEVPLTQVTALLDYREQSALTRSCQRWFETTPRALRASLSSGTAAVALA